jgi:hypothetical protein
LVLEEIKQSSKSFKTWQIALAIGIPTAAIIAYLIYSNKRKTRVPAGNAVKGRTSLTDAKENAAEKKTTDSAPVPKVSSVEISNSSAFTSFLLFLKDNHGACD